MVWTKASFGTAWEVESQMAIDSGKNSGSFLGETRNSQEKSFGSKQNILFDLQTKS